MSIFTSSITYRLSIERMQKYKQEYNRATILCLSLGCGLVWPLSLQLLMYKGVSVE
jgi:hypothetical protein